ncbi:MAG: class I SAM-dependent methyltransferase [Pirellula sp.]|jgi:SAM-dependent methyltransferase|nr:class I SAM-dependent methyltransferase [Pirellula sp.]
MNDYDSYTSWKNWNTAKDVPSWLAKYFDREIGSVLSKDCAKVLEIGFGNGEFLDWTRNKGIQVSGVEIIPELVEKANSKGHDTYLGFLQDVIAKNEKFRTHRFDLIVAFDVFEHLDIPSLKKLLACMSEILSENGVIVARFPNGNSPWSLLFQNGDYTHQTWLTKSKLEQVCIDMTLTLVSYRNAARVPGDSRGRYFKWMVFLIRDLIEILVGNLYFSKRIPLDPNAIAVFRNAAK